MGKGVGGVGDLYSFALSKYRVVLKIKQTGVGRFDDFWVHGVRCSVVSASVIIYQYSKMNDEEKWIEKRGKTRRRRRRRRKRK